MTGNDGSFDRLRELYDKGDIGSIMSFSNGMYFLKLRSMSRPQILRNLADELDIQVPNPREIFEYLFGQNIDEDRIDSFIRAYAKANHDNSVEDRDRLYTELFKMDVLDWGGLYQNGLEKTIVDNYVKKIKGFDDLNAAIKRDLHNSMAGYVRSSWYNHWATVLIEGMFMEHESILPAIGKVKHVDFFWNNIPLDLKVTYIPNDFINDRRRDDGLDHELSSIKKFARRRGIHYDERATPKAVFKELYRKLDESADPHEHEFLADMKQTRMEIIRDATRNPARLARWLYENQGCRRFDRTYRFYLVLVDPTNLEDSWKMKRSRNQVRQEIRRFLDMDPTDKVMDVTFDWQTETYNTKCCVLFVMRGDPTVTTPADLRP